MLSVVIIQIPELHLGFIADALNKIFLIFPNYALGMGIVQLSTNYQLERQCPNYNLDFLCPAFPDSFCCAKRKARLYDSHALIQMPIKKAIIDYTTFFTFVFFAVKSNYLDWDPSGIGRNVVYLLVSFVLYFTILFMYEGRIFTRLLHLYKGNREVAKHFEEDDLEGGNITNIHI